MDGVNLIERARAWEALHTPEPKLAGSYSGVREWNAQDDLRDWFDPTQDRVSLLVCECGTGGCWPLQARVTREGDHVTWSDFEQPHRRGRWSYDGFGPFVFEAGQYDAQVKAVLENV
ncbi:hypothetical protein DAETH_30740 [Deinococcus aetherius]|uniref:Uncharacterized protein n=1 Tax=Deinococcus aetherius TaxID=200252 RepID=A0ABM8AH12_9DEIO|nr:hypothetical protein DAETH_30740 [Deinococcus aetherius]